MADIKSVPTAIFRFAPSKTSGRASILNTILALCGKPVSIQFSEGCPFSLCQLLLKSKPFFLFNDADADDADHYAQDDHVQITKAPAKFRNIKVHAVPADDQGQREKNGGDDGEYLHDLVLLDIDSGLIGFAHLRDKFPEIRYRLLQVMYPSVQCDEAVQSIRRNRLVLIFDQAVDHDRKLLIEPLHFLKMSAAAQ